MSGDESGYVERSHEHQHHLGHCLHEAEWGSIKTMLPVLSGKIDAILAQALLTNGRMRALEMNWAMGKGALLVIVAL